MRKPTSLLETKLTELQQAELADWLLSGMTYWAAIPNIREKFGLKLSSTSAFRPFWEHVCVPQLLARRRLSKVTADAVGEEAKKHPSQFDEATIDLIKQKVFDLSISPNVNPKDVKALLGLVLKHNDQILDGRRLDLLEKQAAKANEATGVMQDKELSEEEKAARMHELFGVT